MDQEDLRRIVMFSNRDEHPVDLVRYLNEHAPVIGRVAILQTPDDGPAPYAVRREWVGIDMPVRCEAEEEDIYPVLAVEGIMALKQASKPQSAYWWRKHYEIAQARTGGRRADLPESMASRSFMLFDRRYSRFDSLVSE